MPKSSTPQSAAQTRVLGLDVLRGVAGLSVLIFHAFLIEPTHQGWWMRFIGQGAEGVGLFFILSALTLGLSWDAHAKKGMAQSRWAFWARRFWRIAPLYYIALLVAALFTRGNVQFAPRAMAHNPFTWGSLLAHLSFLFAWIPAYQNSWIGVGWSIGTEMSFYLLFPWIVEKVIPRVRPEGLVGIGLALVWGWPWFLTHLPFMQWPGWTGAFQLWSLPRQFIWFAIGLWIWKRSGWKPHSGLWALLWIALTLSLANERWINPQTELLVWVFPLGLLVWLVFHQHWAMRLFSRSRLLAYVGIRSYSLYLWHWLILQAVLLRFVPDMHMTGTEGLLVRVAVLLPLSLGVSVVSYRFIEQPGIRYGRRWIARHAVLRSTSSSGNGGESLSDSR